MPRSGEPLVIGVQDNLESPGKLAGKITALHRVTSFNFTLPDIDAAFVVTNNDDGEQSSGTGIVGRGVKDGAGVRGECSAGAGVYGKAFTGTGVKGESIAGAGVSGISSSKAAGVSGMSQGTGVIGATYPDESGIGVLGMGGNRGTGVLGQGSLGGYGCTGVRGKSNTGIGVAAESESGTGVFVRTHTGDGVMAVCGGTTSTGVIGFGGQIGVWGRSTAGKNGRGVYGLATAEGGVGVYGEAVGLDEFVNGIGVLGKTYVDPNTGRFAGLAAKFEGPVEIDGDLRVTGAKSAAVKLRDGSYRLLYAVESPESWFEDFGEGTLKSGKAKVRLAADFAKLIQSAEYHVFLTPRGDSNGLYVSGQSRNGFEVREQRGGKSTLKFSYRVVVKREDVRGRRLEKVKLSPSPERPRPKLKGVPELPSLPEVELPDRPEFPKHTADKPELKRTRKKATK